MADVSSRACLAALGRRGVEREAWPHRTSAGRTGAISRLLSRSPVNRRSILEAGLETDVVTGTLRRRGAGRNRHATGVSAGAIGVPCRAEPGTEAAVATVLEMPDTSGTSLCGEALASHAVKRPEQPKARLETLACGRLGARADYPAGHVQFCIGSVLALRRDARSPAPTSSARTALRTRPVTDKSGSTATG